MEATVNAAVEKLLYDKNFALSIIKEAHKIEKNNSNHKELARIKKLITGLRGHEDALIARVAELPPSVSAAPFYRQLEQVQTAKDKAENSVLEIEQGLSNERRIPIGLEDYQSFLRLVGKAFKRESVAEGRSKLFKRLIHKIEIGTDRVKIHFNVSENAIFRAFEGKKIKKIMA